MGKAGEAEKLAQHALNSANNTLSLANDTTLKANNFEQRLKTMENNQIEFSSQMDLINNKNSNVIKSLEAEATNTNKALAEHTNKIEDIASTLETIARNTGQEISLEISHDVPEDRQLVITHAELLRRGLNAQNNQAKTPANDPTKDNNQPTATITYEEKLEKILETVRKTVGLKPIDRLDITGNQSRTILMTLNTLKREKRQHKSL